MPFDSLNLGMIETLFLS